MALAATRAHGTGASATMSRESETGLLDELSRLQQAILDGKHPQFQLPAASLTQLKVSLADARGAAAGHNALGYRHNAGIQPYSQSAATFGTTRVPLTTKLPASSLSLDGVESLPRSKRQRIESELQEQGERRRSAYFRERDAYPAEVDVDKVYQQAQGIVVPVSGLRSVVAPSRKSSFDENDYYSSQVESAWSPDAIEKAATASQTKAFTADYERFSPSLAPDSSRKRQKLAQATAHHADTTTTASLQVPLPLPQPTSENGDADDEYVPIDADIRTTVYNPVESEPSTPGHDDSDYEPGAVVQHSPTAAFGAATSPPIPVVRNQLTHIAAPQANRVSPLAVQKRPGYELQLVNGRPEVVKIPRARQVSSQVRPSSASSPENGNARSSSRKSKKRKREIEPGPKLKKRRDKQLGLDMSNQIPPQPFVKDEPYSPTVPHALRQQLAQYQSTAGRASEREYPTQAAHVGNSASVAGYYEAAPFDDRRIEPLRAASTVLHAPPLQSMQRRYASLQHVHGEPVLEQPTSSARMVASTDGHGAFGASQHSDYRISELPDARMSMAPPPPPPLRPAKRIVVDQFGNRYVEAGPVASVERPAPHVEDFASQAYARAPSRMSATHVPSPAEQYDPADARFDIPQASSQRAQASSYPVEYIDGRRYRVREFVDNSGIAPPAPTSPGFQPSHHLSHTGTTHTLQPAFQPPTYQRLEPAQQQESGPHYVPVHQLQSHHPSQLVARPFSVHPEHAYHQQQSQQSQPLTYAPRQGSVAPVQYVRHEQSAPLRAVSVAGSAGHAPTYGLDLRHAATTAGNHVKYIDAREYDAQAPYMRPIDDFRQY